MAEIAVTRLELPPADLRRHASASRDAKASRRMLAMALVLEGRSRSEAAETCGMSRQTLRDWVHRYNAEGLAGLADRRSKPGPKPLLTAEQEKEVAQWIEAGPDPARHNGLVRWRRVDLRDAIAREFGAAFHERTIGKLLHRLGFRRLSVCPQHPRSDPAAQEAFKKTSANTSPRRFRNKPVTSRSRSGGKTRPGSVSRAH